MRFCGAVALTGADRFRVDYRPWSTATTDTPRSERPLADHRTPTASRPWVLPAVVVTVVTVLLLAAVAFWPDGDSGTDTAGGTTTSAPDQDGAAQNEAPTEVQGPADIDPSAVERRDPDDPLAAGPADAPVVLVVFSDYQCSFCARWSEDTLPALMEHAEAGDLRIEHRDVNIYGEPSERGARASYAAGLQGEFWAYHDALFQDGEKAGESELSEEALTDLAGELGLDVDQFTADLAAPETADAVAVNQQLGLDLGAYSTPSFLFGGEPVVGAQPTQVFLDAYDAALAASEG